EEIEALAGYKIPVTHQDWRTGDQFYFVADTARLQEAVGWRAGIGWRDGLRDLAEWVQADLGLKLAVPRQQKRLRA
ncbi:MAG TPA: hypothetical protein VGL95_18620, partial [Acetobacteraceae bacterium]